MLRLTAELVEYEDARRGQCVYLNAEPDVVQLGKLVKQADRTHSPRGEEDMFYFIHACTATSQLQGHRHQHDTTQQRIYDGDAGCRLQIPVGEGRT